MCGLKGEKIKPVHLQCINNTHTQTNKQVKTNRGKRERFGIFPQGAIFMQPFLPADAKRCLGLSNLVPTEESPGEARGDFVFDFRQTDTWFGRKQEQHDSFHPRPGSRFSKRWQLI